MKKTLLCIYAMLLGVVGYAQEQNNSPNLPKIVPPSPNAFELTKHGDFPVGLYTGTPNISVPLPVYKTQNLTIPISLSYNSNGIKVDQLSSNVGLGWSLNIGGVISRTVRGKEDENYRLEHPIREINRADLQPLEALPPQPTVEEPVDVDPEVVSFLYNAGKTDYIDSESDLFSYNILGRSGKIVIDNEGVYRTVPHTNLKIERDLSFGRNHFKITTEDGIQYYFYAKETLYSRNRCDNGVVSPPEQGYTSSWYLSKIAHPKGDEVYFSYDNKDVEQLYTVNYSQNLKLADSYPSVNSNFPASYGVTTCETVHRVLKKRLIEVSSNNEKNGKITIDNSEAHPAGIVNYKLIKNISLLDENGQIVNKADFNYDFTTNKRVFLKDVTLKNSKNKYTFEYHNINQFPKRFSESQDYWGYYNGKGTRNLRSGGILLPDLGEVHPIFKKHTNDLVDRSPNHTFSKTGLLTKITYPTKGYTEFNYEGNDYYGIDKQITNEIAVASRRGPNNNSYGLLNLKDYQLAPGEFVSVHLIGTVTGYVNDAEGCYDSPRNKTSAMIIIFDTTNDENRLVYQESYTNENGLNKNIKILPNKSYKILVVRDPNGDPSKCIAANVTVKARKVISTYKNIATGGSRIAAIKSYDSNSDELTTKRYYYYKSLNNKEQSSGDATTAGLGHVSSNTEYKLVTGLRPVTYSQGFSTLSSTGTFPLTNSGSNNVYYKNVFVSYGGDNYEKGGEEHEFAINRDNPGETLLGENRAMSNFTNFGWNHGLERSVKYFKKPKEANTLPKVVKEVVNDYKLDKTISEVSNYSVSKSYNIVGLRPALPTYQCRAGDLTRKVPVWQCQRNHSHFISDSYAGSGIYYSSTDNGKGPITYGNVKCKSLLSDNKVIRYIYHPCYTKSVGTHVSFPSIIRNLHVYKYKTFSYWHYLNRKTQTQYDENGENPITSSTNYFYDNDQHLQLTRTETTDSNGLVLKTKTYYPDDVTSAFSLGHDNLTTTEKAAIDQLKTEHRIAEPIQVESYKNNVLQSTQRTNYKNFGGLYLPEFVQTAKGTSGLEDRVVYHNYDDKGNPVEVSKKDGTKIYYVWGYQQTQPIVKIEGYGSITSAQQTAINNAVAASNNDVSEATENTLRTRLQTLRNSFTNEATQVTTFTYNPLVGVTSVTDPRGVTMYYEYDAFNRLHLVKNSDGHIVKENEYHYKN